MPPWAPVARKLDHYEHERDPLSRERALATLATAQGGVVARRQMAGLGFGDGAIARRQSSGRLLAVHRGVYAVGHSALTEEGRWHAALLACGRVSVISHLSAAIAWRMVRRTGHLVDVTTSDRGRRDRAGLTVHRVRTLHHADSTTHRGVRVTTRCAR